MHNDLIDFLTKINYCETEAEVWDCTTKAVMDIGFNVSIFSMLPELGNPDAIPECLHNYKNGWKEYYADKEYHKHDAFLHHVLDTVMPGTLDCDNPESHLKWGKTGYDILHEVNDAGLKRALIIPMHNDFGRAEGAMTIGTELMTTQEFNHILSAEFPMLYGILTSAYNKLKSLGKISNASQIKLTPRQHDILQFLAKGMSNKQISHHLNIKEVTVSFHLKELRTALNCNVNRQILPKAYALRLIGQSI